LQDFVIIYLNFTDLVELSIILFLLHVFIAYLNNHEQILRSGGDYMAKQQANNSQQQDRKGKNAKEKNQDVKNAEYIARVGQPNHPNT
jgi:hypothetical protein